MNRREFISGALVAPIVASVPFGKPTPDYRGMAILRIWQDDTLIYDADVMVGEMGPGLFIPPQVRRFAYIGFADGAPEPDPQKT